MTLGNKKKIRLKNLIKRAYSSKPTLAGLMYTCHVPLSTTTYQMHPLNFCSLLSPNPSTLPLPVIVHCPASALHLLFQLHLQGFVMCFLFTPHNANTNLLWGMMRSEPGFQTCNMYLLLQKTAQAGVV